MYIPTKLSFLIPGQKTSEFERLCLGKARPITIPLKTLISASVFLSASLPT